MESVQSSRNVVVASDHAASRNGIQQGCFLLELSPDWIVLRASENIHRLLGESHVSLIDEPLGRFVHAQALHDLRNLFSRLSGTTGVARAYRIRLTERPELVDISFQLAGGRVLIEAVHCADAHFGEAFGTVGGLMAGLDGSSGQQLLDGAVRRMRALTGYDRVTLIAGGVRAESSRGGFESALAPGTDVPAMVADCETPAVPVFPHRETDSVLEQALMHAPSELALAQLKTEGVGACVTVPFSTPGGSGYFRCDSKRPRKPNFELHAAAELFAQLFAMRLEIDRLKNGGSAAE